MRKKIIIIAVLIIFLAAAGLYTKEFFPSHSITQQAIAPTKQITSLSYKGENGKDALTLLKEHASIQQDHSGLVVAIDDNKPAGHTYWAFYINGKLATVGPEEYVTKNADTITWKIEKY